jgi:DUF917 family protein
MFNIIKTIIKRSTTFVVSKRGLAMGKRILSKEELWQMVFGAAAIATGGGGACPTYEEFSERADTFLEEVHEPTLIEPTDVRDEDEILCNTGVGGGIRREYAERYPRRYFPSKGWFKQIDLIHPLNSWSKIPEGPTDDHIKKLLEIVGKKPIASVPDEIGPHLADMLYRDARMGLPTVDADWSGCRAVPELSLSTLNVIDAPIGPYTIGTAWGDVIAGYKILSHQRWEDICRTIAVMSGGGCASAITISGETLRKGTEHKTVSYCIKAGKAILEANERGDDPVEALIKTTKGYKIFEGKVAYYTVEPKNAFVYGYAWIEGMGEYEGKTFKLWYQNENQISWIDEEPYVTCPDPFTVIDRKTGLGLSNFRSEWWTPGREVAVCARKACDFWRTKRGLSIYNPKHFGFDIKYVPIEEKLG